MAAVRIRRIRMRERPRRTPLERALMRRPESLRALSDAALRVPGLRTAVLRAVLDRSYAALARGDLEMPAALFYDADVVLYFGDEIGFDYERSYAGRELMFATYRRWLTEWAGVERRPIGFVDRGDTIVVLIRERMHGAVSGLEVDREVGQVFRLRGARVTEQWEYRSWAGALEH